MSFDPLLPSTVCAGYLGISNQTFITRLKRGAIPYYEQGGGPQRKRYQVRLSDMLRYLDQIEPQAPPTLKLLRRSVAAA